MRGITHHVGAAENGCIDYDRDGRQSDGVNGTMQFIFYEVSTNICKYITRLSSVSGMKTAMSWQKYGPSARVNGFSRVTSSLWTDKLSFGNVIPETLFLHLQSTRISPTARSFMTFRLERLDLS